MKGLDPQLCTHHIYTEKYAWPIFQPQKVLNPHLRDIVKHKLQKLLDVNFIFPISDSQWISPLVVVPKKNGKWRICVYYRELNKATEKDHFPLPFVYQVMSPSIATRVLQLPRLPTLFYQPRVLYKPRGENVVYIVNALLYSCTHN